MHIHLLNVVVQFIIFLIHSTHICRSTDISKCFSESLGIRDNESRLYVFGLPRAVKQNMFYIVYRFLCLGNRVVKRTSICHTIEANKPMFSCLLCIKFHREKLPTAIVFTINSRTPKFLQ